MQQQHANNPFAPIDATVSGRGRNQSKQGSSFYFYNPTTVAYGKNEFLRIWGDRKLQDNWRLSNERAGLQKHS